MSRRIEKWKKTLDSDKQKLAFNAQKISMVKSEAFHTHKLVEIEQKVKHECQGVATTLLPYYIIFGKEIYKVFRKHKSETAYNELCILCRKWWERGLDPEYLYKVSILLTGMACFDTIPTGLIVVWSGAVVDIPDGWHICDGTNGTRDLRDSFIVGAGNVYAVGATGGSVSHDHGPGNLRTGAASLTANAAPGIGQIVPMVNHTHFLVSGTTATEDNLPPYYALAFIQKI